MEPASTVELPEGKQVEQVDVAGELGDRTPDRRPGDAIHRVRGEPGAQTPYRSGEPDARIRRRIIDVLLEKYERANPRNEQRRAGGDAEAPELGHVPHLVDIDRYHEPRGERPAELRPVEPEESEHREERARLAQPKYQEFE